MMGIFCAEWLKTKGGALRPLVFLLSPLVGAVLAWYVAGRPWIAAGSAFSGFFSVWAALVMPLALAIVAGQLVQAAAQELRAQGRLTRTSCWYAAQWFEKHPQEQDLLYKE